MENKVPQQYIANMAKTTAYFAFRNGPVKDLLESGKIADEDVKNMQIYMQNHIAYLYNVLLEERNIKKIELIMETMNKFYINDEEPVELNDDGFDNFYNSLFPKNENFTLK